MKKMLKFSVIALSAVMLLTGCNCFKSASKKVETLSATATPSPVSLKGDVVPFTAEVSFPAKFVHKKAIYKITPVFLYEGGEVVANSTFIQGEKVVDNYTVITSTGGAAKIVSEVPYNENLKSSTLVMRVEVQCKKDAPFLPLVDLKAAKGVSTIQNLVKPMAAAYAKDNFKRVTVETQEANLLFKINSSVVQTKELNNEEIQALENFIVESKANTRKTVSDVRTSSFASPDGPVNFNDKLSQQRAKTTKTAVDKRFAKNNINTLLDVDALGEDWEGFKQLVSKSDIAEKDMILQILNMYNDPAKRDEEIKNMSSVFTILAEKILPQLRRSKMEVNVEVQGYTDEELKAIVKSDVSSLNIEEMLFAAVLFSDLETKAKIYDAAMAKYPNCWRAVNNAAAVALNSGNLSKGKQLVAKASSMNSSAAEVVNNLGVVAYKEGNVTVAKDYFASVAGKNEVAKENLGLSYIKLGQYTDAIKYATSANKAVAQILVSDFSGAKQSLKGHTCGIANGLEAIIAAKEGDFKTAEKLANDLKVRKELILAEIELMK